MDKKDKVTESFETLRKGMANIINQFRNDEFGPTARQFAFKALHDALVEQTIETEAIVKKQLEIKEKKGNA